MSTLVKRGSKGDSVREIQVFINVTADGIFGAITEAAVMVWQRSRGLTPDGIVGPLTLAAMRAEGFGSRAEPSREVSAAAPVGIDGIDGRSARNVASLLPAVRPHFERIVIEGTRIAKAMGADSYVMISGTRTYAEQDALYAKGRTVPGPVVTNAKGGHSNHNFGVAGDFGVFHGGVYLDNANPALASHIHKAVAAWVKANLPKIEWGGDWTSFRDESHYQFRTGLSLAQMRARVAAGQPLL